MSALSITRPLGFSLIEMMIAIAIVAILVILGIPSYKTWIHNTQIHTAAESIQNGMQRTRAEAVARNANVAFALAGTDSSWAVTDVTSGATIDSRAGGEGSKNITLTVAPANATTITFTNLGIIAAANADASAPLTQIDIDSSLLSAAESRNLRITVSAGGNVRMCDPDTNLSTTDPRKC